MVKNLSKLEFLFSVYYTSNIFIAYGNIATKLIYIITCDYDVNYKTILDRILSGILLNNSCMQ